MRRKRNNYMKIDQLNAQEFAAKAGQKTRNHPEIPPIEERILRFKLILEEVLELAEASGLAVEDSSGNYISMDNLKFREIELHPDFMEVYHKVADGVADISYVNNGFINSFGIDIEPIDKIVHEANMKKFSKGSYRREDGKWMKPPDWEDPSQKIKEEIRKQFR